MITPEVQSFKTYESGFLSDTPTDAYPSQSIDGKLSGDNDQYITKGLETIKAI